MILALLLRAFHKSPSEVTQHLSDGSDSLKKEAHFNGDDEPQLSLKHAMEELEVKLEASMIASWEAEVNNNLSGEASLAALLESDLKNGLRDDVHVRMQADVENELVESMQSDLRILWENFADDAFGQDDRLSSTL